MSAVFIVLALLLLSVAAWASYQAIYFGSVDPHNVQSTPRPWSAALKSIAVLPAAAIVLIGLPVSKEATDFWVMVSLAMIVGPAIAPPQRERKDEEPDALARTLHVIRDTLSASMFLKLVSLSIGLSLAWVIGQWWFAVLLLLGAALTLGKAGVMRAVISASEGEFAATPPSERLAHRLHWEQVAKKGALGFAVTGLGFGWLFFLHADLSPNNWNGFGGVVFGVVLSNLEVG